MSNPRRYGSSPFSVAVIRGGPGAGGEMAPLAKRLCVSRGILEPLQMAHSLPAQVEELKGILGECADLPVTLIGFSWGAWLSFIIFADLLQILLQRSLVALSGCQLLYLLHDAAAILHGLLFILGNSR
jgi:hypothetical protein